MACDEIKTKGPSSLTWPTYQFGAVKNFFNSFHVGDFLSTSSVSFPRRRDKIHRADNRQTYEYYAVTWVGEYAHLFVTMYVPNVYYDLELSSIGPPQLQPDIRITVDRTISLAD